MKKLENLNKNEFQEFLFDQIPITKTTGFKLEKFVEDEVVISA